jgi:hypothetical protein
MNDASSKRPLVVLIRFTWTFFQEATIDLRAYGASVMPTDDSSFPAFHWDFAIKPETAGAVAGPRRTREMTQPGRHNDSRRQGRIRRAVEDDGDTVRTESQSTGGKDAAQPPISVPVGSRPQAGRAHARWGERGDQSQASHAQEMLAIGRLSHPRSQPARHMSRSACLCPISVALWLRANRLSDVSLARTRSISRLARRSGARPISFGNRIDHPVISRYPSPYALRI